ncbi:MAG TPA: hypothetical protein VGI99_11070 [Gemmataceae bacterium]|jgi:hypothetical protein
MTERQWNGKYDFERYLAATEWLREEKKNHRKLLLWACAACRRLGNLLADKRSWKVIEIAELKADGSAKKADVDKVREAGKAVPRVRQLLKGTPEEFAASAPLFLLNPSSAEFSQTAGIRAAISLEKGGVTTQDDEQRLQFDLLHDVFGNPFRPIAFDPHWRTSTVAKLAEAMYDSRDFSTMPLLGDALQDAGCENSEILDHCRGGKLHIRGCWAIDLVLGKG